MSRFNPRQSPLASNRIVSDSIRQVHHAALIAGTSTIPEVPHSHLEIPSANALGRRRSLPAFHPEMQQHFAHRASHVNSLPTISDFNGQSPDGLSSQGAPTPPSLTVSSPPGHGGAYRFGSIGSKHAPSPYPLRGPSMYRSGSMPGAGVFRVPTNPNGAASWLSGSAEDGGLSNGLACDALGPQSNDNNPFAFPPRRFVPDLPNPGPLPREDFSFGEPQEDVPQDPGLQAPREGESIDEIARRAMAHRFGSFASTYSVESDATGVSGATTTSSVFTPNPTMGSWGRIGNWNGFGVRNSYDSEGPPITYGQTDAVANLSAGPVRFPNRFDPDARRASW